MNALRKVPLLAVLTVALVVTGVAGTVISSPNPVASELSSASSASAESAAIYCTGLTDSSSGAQGVVELLNTTNQKRQAVVSVTNDQGAQQQETITLAGYANTSINPSTLEKGSSYGVAVQVNGGGVIGEEILSKSASALQCQNGGVTSWNAAGLSTLVGNHAYISLFNPTATSAVLNLSTYSPSGFSAPAPFQGISVASHAQMLIDLGTQIVNTDNIGVKVNVLRGALAVTGLQVNGAVPSFTGGANSPSTSGVFPLVTTNLKQGAQIRFMNTTSQVANINLPVTLANYNIATQTLSVPAFSSAQITITPNPAIPAAGYANVTWKSDQPVVAGLLSGDIAGELLSSSPRVGASFSVFTNSGVKPNSVEVTNTSTKNVTVQIRGFSNSLDTTSTAVVVAPGATVNVSNASPTFATDQALFISAARNVLVVNVLSPSEVTESPRVIQP